MKKVSDLTNKITTKIKSTKQIITIYFSFNLSLFSKLESM